MTSKGPFQPKAFYDSMLPKYLVTEVYLKKKKNLNNGNSY